MEIKKIIFSDDLTGWWWKYWMEQYFLERYIYIYIYYVPYTYTYAYVYVYIHMVDIDVLIEKQNSHCSHFFSLICEWVSHIYP